MPSFTHSTHFATAEDQSPNGPATQLELQHLEMDVMGPGTQPTLVALGEPHVDENGSDSSRRAEVDDDQQHPPPQDDPQPLEREYATNPLTLAFNDPETELRYTQFIYIHSGFYGGKLWHILTISATSTFMFLYHPQGMGAGLTLLTDPRYALCNITVLSSIVTLFLIFQERFYAYREHLLLFSLVTHWPALATLVTIAKKPQPIAYAVCLSCYFFCAFISQIRFCRLLPFVTLTPVLTLIILVTTQPGYFDRHSVTELAFWPCVFFPIMLLRTFETIGRRSFHVVEKCERRVEALELKIEMAQQTIANFFPPTPTVDLLVRHAASFRASPAIQSVSLSHMRTTTASTDNSQHQSHDEDIGLGNKGHTTGDIATDVEMAELSSTSNESDSCNTPAAAWSIGEDASTSTSTTHPIPRQVSLKVPASHHHAKPCMIYSNAAMVVTDLAGFTQWTSSCAQDPSMVITLLTKMFLTIDKLMPLYKVEKVATVGDAFIGVIFDDAPNQNYERRGLRALHAIQFGCNILAAATSEVTGLSQEASLNMRVGVHLGEFVGGFVGTAPPKFDCFGEEFEKAKTLESSGRPDMVHLSTEALAAALTWERLHVQPGAGQALAQEDTMLNEFYEKCSGECERTELGVLCKRWPGFQDESATPVPQNKADHVVDVDLGDDAQLLPGSSQGGARLLLSDPLPTVVDTQYTEIVRDSAIDICETLVSMRHSRDRRPPLDRCASATNPLQRSNNCEPDDGLPTFVSYTPPNSRHHNEAPPPIDGEVKDPYDFHFIFLEFFDKQTERQYQAALLSGSLLTTSFSIMGLLELMLVFAHSMNACLETVENRLLLGICVGSNALWLGVTHHFGIKNYKAVVLALACAHVNLAASYFNTSDCGSRGADLGTADIAVSYFVVASMCVEFALVFSLKTRVVLNILTISFTYTLHLIRVTAVIGEDEAFGYDWNLFTYGSAIATHVGVSFFIDFTQRSSFASARKLRRLLLSTKGKHADVATKALEIMLPAFVTEELASSSKKAETSRQNRDDGEASETSRLIGGGASVANTLRGATKAVDLEVLRKGMVWEYQSVVVMFIAFTPISVKHPSDRSTNNMRDLLEQYHRINATIVRLEQILSKHDVQKVKTIGSGMLAVAGIDSGAGAVEPHRKIFNAALQIQRELASQRCFAHVRIGINSGACFGAVIGVKGLCFDIFGDTVNIASRMCSIAKNGTIQVTDAARMTALASNQVPSRSKFQPIDAVVVKGKGKMAVYQLVEEQP